MNRKTYSFAFFVVFLVTSLPLLISSSPPPPAPPNSGAVCESTLHPSLCRSIVSPAGPPAELQSLKSASRMSALVHRRLNQSRYSGVAVDDCRRLFELNGELLKSVAADLRESSAAANHHHRTRSRLSAVLTNYHTCCDGLVEAESPFLGGAETEAVMTRAGKVYSVALRLVTQSLSQNTSRSHNNNNHRTSPAAAPSRRHHGHHPHHPHHHHHHHSHRHAAPAPPQRHQSSTPPPSPPSPRRSPNHTPSPPSGHHNADHQSRADIIKALKKSMSCDSSTSSCSKRRLMLPGLQRNGILVNEVAIVSKDGSGDFTTIGDALNAAPDNLSPEDGHFLIYATKGVYEEYISVSTHKKNILLVGDGMNSTIITGDRSNIGGWGTSNSATFAVAGERFIAIDTTFRNTHGPGSQAVAVRNQADMSAFFRCSFEGYQDTLFVHSMNHFYRDCHVSGSVDFIFGDAAAVFQNCHIIGRRDVAVTIAAQGRTQSDAASGIAFHNCTVEASPELATDEENGRRKNSFLGRPWKPYARTVYVQSYIGGFINSDGWLEWNGSEEGLDTLYYGEYRNRGPGAATGGRVTWPGYDGSMSTAEAMRFSVGNFTDGDSWLPATAIPYYSGLLDQ